MWRVSLIPGLPITKLFSAFESGVATGQELGSQAWRMATFGTGATRGAPSAPGSASLSRGLQASHCIGFLRPHACLPSPCGTSQPLSYARPCEAQHLPPRSVEWLPFLLPRLSAQDCSPPMTHERTPDTSPPPSQTAGPGVHSSPGTLWRCHFRSTSAPVSARQAQHLHPLITQPASKVPFWKAALAPAFESFWF